MPFLHAGSDFNPDQRSSVAAAVLLGISANISFIIQPGLVGGFVEVLGLTEAVAGELAAMEMFGVAFATIVLSVASLRVNWRLSLVVFALIAVLGNCLSATVSGMEQLPFARLLSGFGHGGLISLSFSAIGLTSRTDRNLGIYLTVLLSYGALGLLFMPFLLDAIGITGLFFAFAAAALLALLALPFMPSGPKREEEMEIATAPMKWRLLLPTLLGFLAYNTSQGIAWAYLFLIGLSGGLEEQAVANAMFLSQIFGVLGAILAVIISAKVFGRFGPITLGILGGAAFIALLMPGVTPITYLVAVCGFNLAWNKVLPFILAAIADFDMRGRVMSFALAIQMSGLAVGPYIASKVVGDGDYFAVELASVLFFVTGYVLLIFPIMAHQKLLRAARNETRR